MPNYLYNGVELPALPEWDKEKYPYAVIFRNSGDKYILWAMPVEGVYRKDATIAIPKIYDNVVYFAYKEGDYVRAEIVDDAWESSIETRLNFLQIPLDKLDGSIVSTIIWTNHDIISNTDGSVYFATSTPVPVVTNTLDPTALLMGWMVGKRVAGMRSQRSVTYNLADFPGEYSVTLTRNDREFIDFAVGEFPLSFTQRDEEVGDASNIVAHLQAFSAKAGTKVTVDYYFPDVILSYKSQCTNFSGRTVLGFWVQRGTDQMTDFSIIANENTNFEFYSEYGRAIFSDGYTLTPKTIDGVCVGFTFTGTLAVDLSEKDSRIDIAYYCNYDKFPDGTVGYMRMKHHNYDSLSIKVTPTSNDVPVVPDEPDTPDEPSGDPVAYLYNGVRLPDINAVWTDELKTQYPYAYIRGEGGDEFCYELLFASQPFARFNDFLISFDVEGGLGSGKLYYYDYVEAESGWLFYEDFEQAAGETEGYTDLWTSHDIPVIDDNAQPTGATYLAASDPVPVYE